MRGDKAKGLSGGNGDGVLIMKSIGIFLWVAIYFLSSVQGIASKSVAEKKTSKKVPSGQKNSNNKKKAKAKIIPAAIVLPPWDGPFKDPVCESVAPGELLAKQLEHYEPSRQHHIIVVTLSYNNADWYQRNLASIYGQDYESYSIMYVDDASSDHTGELVAQYISQQKQEQRTTLLINKINQKALSNFYHVIMKLPADAIVVILDGDDWFLKPTVLSLINKVYDKYNVLMTYGSYQDYPTGKIGVCCELPKEVIQNNSCRAYKWVTSHLRTFKAGLFQRIKKEDLFYEGTFFERTCDLACMFPMLEMAGVRSMYIPDVLYGYNRATPLNDLKVAKEQQRFLIHYIRSKAQYSPLPPDVSL